MSFSSGTETIMAAAEVASWLLPLVGGFAEELRPAESASSIAVRGRGAIDLLLRSGIEAIRVCERAVLDEPHVAAPLALVAIDLAERCDPKHLVAVLASDCPETYTSAMLGARLAAATTLPHCVAKQFPLADLAMRAHHRTASQPLLVSVLSNSRTDLDGQLRLVAAASRIGGPIADSLVKLGCDHSRPEIRRNSLRAGARMGASWLLTLCRDRMLECGDAEATAMLGTLGNDDDAAMLRACVDRHQEPQAAVTALARLGRPEDAVFLLELLDHPPLAEPAAQALHRMFAIEIPRGLPREPPPGLTEEELDVWDTTGPIEIAAIRSWWMSARHRYQFGARYQWNTLVSVDPLGPAFDSLPTCVQHDLYLRERLLNHDRTPDWELETWPWLRRSYA
jgi:hypothetical protein